MTLEGFLDAAGLGSGPVRSEPIGEGHSNLTYLLRRGPERFVLRRPPRGELAPSANDVLREARLLAALAPFGLPVPSVLATCEDESVIGAPFYVMPFIEGEVLVEALPGAYGPRAPELVAGELVATMAKLHAVDPGGPALAPFGRPSGYLARQLKRFGSLLEHNATRPLPDLEAVARWLADYLPESPATTVVHGDFRLGNAMYAPGEPRLVAMLDWEMATLGDPLADLGYCSAMWAQPGDDPNPMHDLSEVTRGGGFPSRSWLIESYAEATGRDVSGIVWYQVLALWKSAIFLEGSYGRYLTGATDDEYFARLGSGVEVLARLALARTAGDPEAPLTDPTAHTTQSRER